MIPFKVGDKVVCIIEGPQPQPVPIVPQVGETYTVRDMVTVVTRAGEPLVGISVVEVPNQLDGTGRVQYFNAARFRPLVSDSSEMFRKLVAPIFKREKIDA